VQVGLLQWDDAGRLGTRWVGVGGAFVPEDGGVDAAAETLVASVREGPDPIVVNLIGSIQDELRAQILETLISI
jgi:hypothetical protein